jgi:hypothetical protein
MLGNTLKTWGTYWELNENLMRTLWEHNKNNINLAPPPSLYTKKDPNACDFTFLVARFFSRTYVLCHFWPRLMARVKL